MKFTNYKNCMQAVTGLIKSGWSLERVDVRLIDSDGGVTTLKLYHYELELSYILEHHSHRETFDESPLNPFYRKRFSASSNYVREITFPDPNEPPAGEVTVQPGERPFR